MKRIVATLLLLAALTGWACAQTRVTIIGTHASFVFPGKWKCLTTTQVDKNTNTYLYCYSERDIASEGDTATPFLAIRVQKGYRGSVFDYAFSRYTAKPYQAIDDYTQGLGLPASGGLGYVGAYTSLTDDKDYQFRMVYFKDKDVIVEFRLETTRATFDQMEEEFDAILKSLTL